MRKNIDDICLYDPDKIGTIILSHYRSGTHFLHDIVTSTCPNNLSRPLNEVDNINVISKIKKSNNYPVAIFNCLNCKFSLISRAGQEIMEQWHLIRLTRKNKVSHFISHYFWSLNSPDQRINGQGKFKHNNTDRAVYANFIESNPIHYPIEGVQFWLQEQMILNYLPYHEILDYDDLFVYEKIIPWTPNRYDNVTLKDLFINHNEISDLLTNFSHNLLYP